MCRKLALYYSFVSETEKKTFDEYMELFRRSVCMDIVLVVLYGVLAVVSMTSLKLPGNSEQPLQTLQKILMCVVIVLWLVDACLLTNFIKIVRSCQHTLMQPTAMQKMILWKRICATNAGVGLAVYTVRLGINLLLGAQHGIHQNMLIQFLMLGFVLALKVMRVLAVNSFSKWLRLMGASTQFLPTTGTQPTTGNATSFNVA